MSNKKTKTLVLNTLLLVFCVVIIALFCLIPNKEPSLKEEVASYKINFDTAGGNEIAAVSIDEGKTITKPNDPVKEGYLFIGWYLGDELYDFSKGISEDIVLTAKWEKVEEGVNYYIVAFNTLGGTTIANQTVKEGELPTRPENPVYEGYIFEKWELFGTDYNFDTPVTADTVIMAVWKVDPNYKPEEPEKDPEKEEEKTYTVKFNTGGGTTVKTQTIKENGKVSKPTNPTRTGYTFVEWQLNGKKYDFNSKVTKNLTLTAVWKQVIVEKPKYTIRFDVNGGSGSCSNLTVESGASANTNTCKNKISKKYYSFVSWKGDDGKTYSGSFNVSKNLTLTAQWSKMKFNVVASVAGDAVTSNGFNLSLKQSYKPSLIVIKYKMGNKDMSTNATCNNGVCYTSNKLAWEKAVSFDIKFSDSDETFEGSK